jgi:hypothetical protein
MKILYAVQATGNGHISRAAQLYPYLQRLGSVDIFLSGNNSHLKTPFPVTYQSKGLSLYFNQCGGLNYWRVAKGIRPLALMKEALQLPVKKYDMIINDFESITALACKLQQKPSVQFGHQASFQSENCPRPEKNDPIGEWILANYAQASSYLGLHFQRYDSFIHPPVIKAELQQATVSDQGHVSIYLPAYKRVCLEASLLSMSDIEFHWFLPEINTSFRHQNITYFPVFQELFNESMLSSHGVITGGGFETPAEALYLGKKLLSIPVRKHYEQLCNAAALQAMGIKVLEDIDSHFEQEVTTWYASPRASVDIQANAIQETLQYLADTYPYKQSQSEQDYALFV